LSKGLADLPRGRPPTEKGSRKERVTAWVKPDVSATLAAMAGAQRTTVSELAAAILERGVKQEAEAVGLELILPAVERQVQRTGRYVADRLANLLARSALDAASSRRLLYQLLVQEVGEERAKKLYESSWNAGVASLKKPSAGVRELLGGADDHADRGESEL
jgi:hypothetical protein